MKIIAKSAPCKEHINEKIGIGTKDIEIQLLPNFDDNCDIDFFYKNILSTSCNVDIVHMPLESGLDLNFELIQNSNLFSLNVVSFLKN